MQIHERIYGRGLKIQIHERIYGTKWLALILILQQMLMKKKRRLKRQAPRDGFVEDWGEVRLVRGVEAYIFAVNDQT